MKTPVKRKLKRTAAPENYMLAGSAETAEDLTSNIVPVHTTYYEMLEKV